MAYAIIEMGGKQYRVEKGDSVVVDRVAQDEGSKLTPRALMYGGDGDKHTVGAGTAILTRPGSSHSLKQTGTEDLVIIIAYPPEKR